MQPLPVGRLPSGCSCGKPLPAGRQPRPVEPASTPVLPARYPWPPSSDNPRVRPELPIAASLSSDVPRVPEESVPHLAPAVREAEGSPTRVAPAVREPEGLPRHVAPAVQEPPLRPATAIPEPEGPPPRLAMVIPEPDGPPPSRVLLQNIEVNVTVWGDSLSTPQHELDHVISAKKF